VLARRGDEDDEAAAAQATAEEFFEPGAEQADGEDADAGADTAKS
jgi:hypothetical protein